ncbi:MAG: phage integrase N-terminal domain-containing protein [Bacteroidota bacterium]
MKGSINYQVGKVMGEVFSPGQSRHVDKANAREELAEKGIPLTMQNINRLTDIHSYRSYYDYKDTVKDLMEHVREEYGVKDIQQIEEKHVQSFLESRTADEISYSTFRKECSHLQKFERALEKFDGKTRDFSSSIEAAKEEAREVLSRNQKETGGFNNPQAVIEKLNNQNHKIAANIQLESGCRVHETVLIKPEQLRGLGHDSFSGQQKGLIDVRGKGGKFREVKVSVNTYNKLKEVVDKDGVFKTNYHNYRSAVYQAAKSLNEPVSGTHDFRYCFAQNRMSELQTKGGMDYYSARQDVSIEMGHVRPGITEVYLR